MTERPTLSKLKGTRSAHRGQMTKLLKKADENVNVFPQDNIEGALDSLTAIHNLISSKYENLINLDKQIVEQTEENSLEATITESDDYLTDIYEKKHILSRFIERKSRADTSPPTSPAVPAAASTSSAVTIAASSTQPNRTINLPKLSLPTFNGDVLKWVSFRDAFYSAVHNNPNLEKIQRFQYLHAQLSDEAAHTIEGLTLTNENYDHAIDLLEQRYGQKHKVISAYMKALWDMPKPSSDFNSLRNFYDTLESYIRGLSSLGKSEESYGDLLVPIVMEKLPPNTRKQIARDHGNNEWNLPELRQAIHNEMDALQAGFSADIHDRELYTETPVTAAFYTGSDPVTSRKSIRARPTKSIVCAYCKDAHPSIHCKVVTDYNKCLEIIKRDRLCFNCLGKHKVTDCQSKFSCRACRRKHHTSLCKGTSTSNDKSSTTPVTQTHVNFTTAANTASHNGPVLLKTAVTEVFAGSETATATILFDEGATRSFVTTYFADKLNAQTDKCEVINLATFGDNGSRARSFNVSTLSVHTITGKKKNISALVVPNISTPTKNLITSSLLELPHLRNLNLAHPISGSESFEISILIGADYYWNFVGDHIVRGPGPTAVSSILGYLLSGSIQGYRPKSVFANDATILHIATNPSVVNDQLQDYWKLETIGITDNAQPPVMNTDFEHYRDNHLKIENGRYTAGLPWRQDHPLLPTNFRIAEKRTRAMTRKLPPHLLQTYDGIIKNHKARNFIEEVTDDDNLRGPLKPEITRRTPATTAAAIARLRIQNINDI
ncbi:uncharacterized protein LOC102808985 [Saccoglossus kowalevskii]|uniref:Uncharacterized protein LOC102808985 n=1 Tax=Saccoglossus kowalevskii TaxID=10224 RepID=A0ABM0MYX8_SACKO|nr:PREDICTED: uncharacterized protein LOC102808985 [Saccoglossus kowalevskii]